ncbi:hypothetical protein SEA_ABBA_10 [Arthrobacter phage Abba]|uniref:Uncharacterized protein n=1 Tax=Arthrobacter phage Abba TaxID=2713256 RepID=A0A6G8R2B3_9CAUD|nr:hypothetical protein HYQ28_gp10 [Arthrobacter phage Abba]QIN94339.1 hypothetical protein SEA_ABBA_10 [Arthrobacter phage Abba]
MADTSPATWGVTVDEVSALAPHVGIIDNPAPADVPVDDVFGGEASRKVTKQAVEAWIQDISGRVSLTLRRRSKLTDAALISALNASAHNIIVNGAASYLVAAAHPNEAAINSQTNYNAVLWQRYVDGLAELRVELDAWLTEDGFAPGAPTGRGFISAPAPLFPDGMRW